MPGEFLRAGVFPSLGIKGPDPELVVASSRHEFPLDRPLAARIPPDQASRGDGGGPAYSVDALAVRRKDFRAPVSFAELEDGDLAVGRGTGQQAAQLMRRPGNEVDGCGVECEGGDAGPLRGGFAPDEDPGVVG